MKIVATHVRIAGYQRSFFIDRGFAQLTILFFFCKTLAPVPYFNLQGVTFESRNRPTVLSGPQQLLKLERIRLK